MASILRYTKTNAKTINAKITPQIKSPHQVLKGIRSKEKQVAATEIARVMRDIPKK